ncbi:MAG: hypothetical protein ACTHK7_03500 [Aureliella sp.]
MTDNPNLAKIKTVHVDGPDGPMIAIMANFNFDPPLTDAMVRGAVELIRNQRMCSPPGTNALLVTIIGDVTLDEFVPKWHDAVAADPAMSVFMPMMAIADVMRGTEAGELLESGSLITGA